MKPINNSFRGWWFHIRSSWQIFFGVHCYLFEMSLWEWVRYSSGCEPGIFTSQRENMCFFCCTHFKQIYVPKQARLIPRLMWSCDVLTFPTLSLRNHLFARPSPLFRRLFFLVFMLLGRSGTQQGRWNGSRSNKQLAGNGSKYHKKQDGSKGYIITWHKYSCLVFICLIFWECENLQYRYWYGLMFFHLCSPLIRWSNGPFLSQAYSADIAAFYQEAAVNAGADYFHRLCLVHQKIHIQG